MNNDTKGSRKKRGPTSIFVTNKLITSISDLFEVLVEEISNVLGKLSADYRNDSIISSYLHPERELRRELLEQENQGR